MKLINYGYYFLGLALWLMASMILDWPDDKFYMVTCDVGQGDAILIKKRFNQILIDAGKGEEVIECLENNLPFWDKKLELVVATHDDFDHIGGMDKVFKKYKIDLLIDNGIESEKSEWKEITDIITRREIKRSNTYEMGNLQIEGVNFEFLWPKGECPSSSNECSVVTKISYGKFDALLTGDIDGQIEEEMMWENIESEVLKVTHHGSKEGSSEEFLKKGKFELAIIGVGKNNYGHPSEEVLERLEKLGIKIRRTDKDGEIVIVSDGEKYWERK